MVRRQVQAVRRPGVVCDVVVDPSGPGPELAYESTLSQAIENLLNNAADTGSQKIAVSVTWGPREASIGVRDWGAGILPELLEQIGKPIIHAGRSGLGIGLMLSQASVERHGGRIELRNLHEGGTLATLTLPLEPRTTETTQL